MRRLGHFKKEILVEYKSGVLEYYSDLNMLIVIWNGSITRDDVLTGGKIFLHHIKNQPAKFLLFDQRVLKGTWVQGNEYLQNYWLPEILKTSIQKIAFIPSPDDFAKYCLLQFIEKVETGDLNVFANLEDALKWLLKGEYKSKFISDQDSLIKENQVIIRHLYKLLNEKKVYRNSRITLSDVAKMLKIPPKKLSLIINLAFNKNFNEFINEYRIKEIISNLQNGEKKKLTIWGIAHESGFASRASFYRSFKKETNLSPTQFITKQSI